MMASRTIVRSYHIQEDFPIVQPLLGHCKCQNGQEICLDWQLLWRLLHPIVPTHPRPYLNVIMISFFVCINNLNIDISKDSLMKKKTALVLILSFIIMNGDYDNKKENVHVHRCDWSVCVHYVLPAACCHIHFIWYVCACPEPNNRNYFNIKCVLCASHNTVNKQRCSLLHCATNQTLLVSQLPLLCKYFQYQKWPVLFFRSVLLINKMMSQQNGMHNYNVYHALLR